MTGSSQSALAAALAVARAQGMHCKEPVVLREAWHVLVHLRPLPIVARVSSGIPFPQGPKPDDVVRELKVADYAARAGAPVILHITWESWHTISTTDPGQMLNDEQH